MARYRIENVRNYSVAGFQFTNHEMHIDDSDTARIAKWNKLWATLPPQRKVAIRLVDERTLEQLTSGSGIRGPMTSRIGQAIPGSVGGVMASLPDGEGKASIELSAAELEAIRQMRAGKSEGGKAPAEDGKDSPQVATAQPAPSAAAKPVDLSGLKL